MDSPNTQPLPNRNDTLLVVVSILCAAGSVLSVLLYFTLPTAPTGDPPPTVSSDFEVQPSTVQDFRQVKQGTSTPITYSLVNVSSRTLKIATVVTSCGCTTTSISKMEIAPGEKTVLTLSYNSGQMRQSIHVVTDVIYSDGTKNEYEFLQLEAKGEIDPDYGIKPEQLQYEAGKKQSKRIVVWPRHTKNLKVTNVACDKRFFSTRILDQRSNTPVQIEVTFDPSEYYPSAGSAQLSISTNSQVQPVALIPIEVIQ